MSYQVLLYSGSGAGPFCTYALKECLEEHLDRNFCQINETKEMDLDSQVDMQSVKAFFVPGGNAAAMVAAHFFDCDSIDSNVDYSKMAAVRERMDRFGVSYYGECAGGILASHDLHQSISKRMYRKSPEGNKEYHNMFLAESQNYAGWCPVKSISPLKTQEAKTRTIADFKLHTVQIWEERKLKSVQIPFIFGTAYTQYTALQDRMSDVGTFQFPFRFAYSSINRDCKAVPSSAIPCQNLYAAVFHKRINPSGMTSQVILHGGHPSIGSTQIESDLFRRTFNATSDQQNQLAEEMRLFDIGREEMVRSHFREMGLDCRPNDSKA